VRGPSSLSGSPGSARFRRVVAIHANLPHARSRRNHPACKGFTLEDRVLALEWLRIRSPYTSIRETAQNELQRIRDSEGVRKLERESDVLKKERTEVGRGGGQNLQRVEQAKKVLLLRDLFGTVPPPQRKGAL
jgi:hypothetical protein